MEFRVLGPLEVRAAGARCRSRARAARAPGVVARHANRVVSRDRLIDELWGEQPPETAVHDLQVYVSHLRKVLPPETLDAAARLPARGRAGELDLHASRLLAEGRAGARPAVRDGRPTSCGKRSRSGGGRRSRISPSSRSRRRRSARLEELRLAALEHRIEADLALGRHAELSASSRR